MPRWESNSVLKLHEGCGGLVRWVEAYDDPHVGYTGECLECSSDRLPVEHIIPVEIDDGRTATDLYNDADVETLRELEWDDTTAWDANQDRLREAIEA